MSLHAAWFIIPVAIWCLYATVNERSQAIKHSYQEVLKSIGLYAGFNLCALVVFKLGQEYDRGNLFTGGAEDFGYMLMHFAAAGVLALVGAIWPLIRLVKGIQLVNKLREGE
ncbi:hypothetical protein [Litoribacillus peritrichatus]|uniref:Integral membrane protein n=1 Tax=Litoribacillus peritrichatus TaxID=718191 RepID=A0ABP7MC68_9GAMM